jgi:hypothetical protein
MFQPGFPTDGCRIGCDLMNLFFVFNNIHVGIEGAVSAISSASITWDSSSVST